jgi:hypothetical protein
LKIPWKIETCAFPTTSPRIVAEPQPACGPPGRDDVLAGIEDRPKPSGSPRPVLVRSDDGGPSEPFIMRHGVAPSMTNADSLALIVTALGGTPAGTTNAELIQEIAVLLGSEASADTNSEALSALAAALTGKTVGTGQTKTATPKTTKVTVTPDTGKVLTKVEVSAVTAAIDANIVAENIKSGVTILGVEGTYGGK